MGHTSVFPHRVYVSGHPGPVATSGDGTSAAGVAADPDRSVDPKPGIIEQLSLGTIWAVLQDALGSPCWVTRTPAV